MVENVSRDIAQTVFHGIVAILANDDDVDAGRSLRDDRRRRVAVFDHGLQTLIPVDGEDELAHG